MLSNSKKYITELKSMLDLECSLDELWYLTESSPWIVYNTTIKSNLLAKVIIFDDENYIEMLLFLHSKYWYQNQR